MKSQPNLNNAALIWMAYPSKETMQYGGALAYNPRLVALVAEAEIRTIGQPMNGTSLEVALICRRATEQGVLLDADVIELAKFVLAKRTQEETKDLALKRTLKHLDMTEDQFQDLVICLREKL